MCFTFFQLGRVYYFLNLGEFIYDIAAKARLPILFWKLSYTYDSLIQIWLNI